MNPIWIIIAVMVFFIAVICSHIAGYNHGYKDASMKHFDRAMEKDQNIRELCTRVGKQESELIEFRHRRDIVIKAHKNKKNAENKT